MNKKNKNFKKILKNNKRIRNSINIKSNHQKNNQMKNMFNLMN